MSRGFPSLVSLFIAWGFLSSTAGAGIPTGKHFINIEHKSGEAPGYLSFQNGTLTIDPKAGGIEENHGPAGAYWDPAVPYIKSPVAKRYLAYDPTADDGKVILVAERDKGAEWKFSPANPEPFGAPGEGKGVLQAAHGPMKGWYLGVEEVKEKRSNGKTVTTYRVVLSKSPARRLLIEQIVLHK